MATTGSVSKGHFVFKGKRKVARSKDYFLEAEEDKYLKARFEAYEYVWEQISETLEILQADINTHIFRELMKFTKNTQSEFSLETETKKRRKEIPTAALITGVNMPDHSIMFSNLCLALRETVTPHVAVLKSKDCANIKTTVDKTVVQFMQNTDVLEDEDLDEQMNFKRVNCTLSVLTSWYRNLVLTKNQSQSPKKLKSSSTDSCDVAQCPPLVVILEDLEGFSPHVLQDFITVCSNYLSELPLVMVFGIATAVTAVHRLLPHQVSSLLCIEKFQALPPTEYLTQVIEKVILSSKCPCKFGSRVYKLLIDLFLFHDFSVVNFIRGIQFSLMDHYLSHPYSILCVPLDVAMETMKEMSAHDLDIVRRLTSFRRHVESCGPKEQILLLTDSKHAKTFILTSLFDLHEQFKAAIFVLRCLQAFTHFLPGQPLGKLVRQVYAEYLESNMCETEAYKNCFALLRNLSKDELRACVVSCVDILASDDVPEEFVTNKEDLQSLCDKIDNMNDLGQLNEVNENTDTIEEQNQILPEKTNMYALRQKLQEMQKQKKKLTVFEILRNEILDYLDSFFRKHLVCPRQYPLHEILYYDSVQQIKQHINGSPRASIQTALSNPYYYLQNEGCRCDGGGFSPTLPDICIAYKLHVECGRLINLYDWMQAFATVLFSGDGTDEPSKPDKVVQARFIRAVSELQVLGFIKPTKKKKVPTATLR